MKYNPNGKIERCKVRLVAKGFTQTFGIDYSKTFALVAKLNSIRIFLSLAANSDWPLYQLDIKNAFLNRELVEEVYMELPPRFFDDQGNKKVYKLNKSIYGLKQSPRAWFGRFSQVLRRHGYSQGHADHTMFYKHSVDGKIVILIVYIDDIIFTRDDIDGMEKLKRVLANEFEVKDLGFLRYFLGMEVARTTQGIVVCQRKFTPDLLEETGMLGCKAIDTPMEVNKREENLDEKMSVDKGRYQCLVGKLIYLSHTHPNIAFAVNRVNQHMHLPTKDHMLRYLKTTPGKGLFFRKK